MIHLRQDLRQNQFMVKTYPDATVNLTLDFSTNSQFLGIMTQSVGFLKKPLNQIF